MTLFSDNSGIAYALTYIMVVLIVVGAAWIMLGIMVDEFNILSENLVSQEMWGDKTTNAVEDLKTCWNLVLWLTVGCSFIYAIVQAIRKERGGVIGD